MDMDSFDSKVAHSNTYWWITSLAISVVCCSVLFVWFSNYIYQIKEELAIARVRTEVAESRIKEMSLDLQMLNHRNSVQQIQIIPNGNAPAQPSAPSAIAAPPVSAPALGTEAPAPAAVVPQPPVAAPVPETAPPAAAIAAPPAIASPPLVSPPEAPPAPPPPANIELPVPSSAPAKQ